MARPLYERALAITKEVLGERHPDYAASLNNLAELLRSKGDYAGARPLYERAVVIWKDVLGERHPHYAVSLSNLGFLAWARSDVTAASPLLTRALEIAERNLDVAAAVQSEHAATAMAHALRYDLDAYLSISRLAKLSTNDVYGHVLGTKGAVLKRRRRLRTQRGLLQTSPGSEGTSGSEEYARTVTQLATVALSAQWPEKPSNGERLEELSRRKDDLEAELSRLDAGFRTAQQIATSTPAELQVSLPDATTALVDYLAYTAYQPPAAGRGEFQSERRLLAFVLRQGRPVERVELGPLAAIQKVVDNWRSSATRPECRRGGRRRWPSLAAVGLGAAGSPPRRSRLGPGVAGRPDRSRSDGGTAGKGSQPLPDRGLLDRDRARAEDACVGRDRLRSRPTHRRPNRAGSVTASGRGHRLRRRARQIEPAMQRTAAVSARGGFLMEFKPLAATGDEIASIRALLPKSLPRRRDAGARRSRRPRKHSVARRFGIGLSTWPRTITCAPELHSRLGQPIPRRSVPALILWVAPVSRAIIPGLLSGIALPARTSAPRLSARMTAS